MRRGVTAKDTCLLLRVTGSDIIGWCWLHNFVNILNPLYGTISNDGFHGMWIVSQTKPLFFFNQWGKWIPPEWLSKTENKP